ncbi:hypothetical protein [Pyrodictium abyssi]|uniref:Uncharacterized protein n=1 Tax=Pyrodictium abyssi TaxID=54256 RepID=A0ABN6ZL95_9CREN|nr:hypothetical protein PABY_05710 [Pyrodictium abyssi]
MRRLLRPPREPSALGIMAFSALVGLATAASPSPAGLALAVAAVLLHVFTFDAAFDAARLRRRGLLAALAALNASPYLLAVLLWRDWVLAAAVLAYAPVLAVYLVLSLRGALRTPPGYIAGAALLAYTAVLSAALAGEPTRLTLAGFALMMLYTASTAAYVETRLPTRRTSPLLPLAVWLPALPVAAATWPWLLLACIEPTAKLMVNAARNTKIDMREIRRLGWRELARLTLFTALLTASLAVLRGTDPEAP